MKKLLLFMLFPMMVMGQTQIGDDIDGEAEQDSAGREIKISGDGTTVVVGSVNNDTNANNAGQVRIFKILDNIWTQVGQAIDGEGDDERFGTTLSLSSDGSIVAITSSRDSQNNTTPGYVKVFRFVNNDWLQIGETITGMDTGGSGIIGISLSSDGNILAIGEPTNSEIAQDSGQVRVFENIDDVWIQLGESIVGEQGDFLGRYIDISAEGAVVAVSAVGNSIGGAVKIYEFESSNWLQIGTIEGTINNGSFGRQLDLTTDGRFIVICNESAIPGRVEVYENISNNWLQVGNTLEGSQNLAGYGIDAVISADASFIVVGAFQADTENGDNTGRVIIYQNQGSTWVQIGEGINGNTPLSSFGQFLDISREGSILAIGAPSAPGSTGAGSSAGTVRVYDLSALLSTPENNTTTFNLYPNPASNQITIQLQDDTLKKVSIYNNLGQLVKTSIKATIDISQLATGVYIVQIETNDGKGVQKLIIE